MKLYEVKDITFPLELSLIYSETSSSIRIIKTKKDWDFVMRSLDIRNLTVRFNKNINGILRIDAIKEVTETETPVAEEEDVKEDNTAITTDAEITIVEDEIIVDDIEDADSELNTDSATTPNITPAQAMVDKKICDFNGDDKYNAKDRLYITTHRTIKAPNLNNRTDSSRILISAYTE